MIEVDLVWLASFDAPQTSLFCVVIEHCDGNVRGVISSVQFETGQTSQKMSPSRSNTWNEANCACPTTDRLCNKGKKELN